MLVLTPVPMQWYINIYFFFFNVKIGLRVTIPSDGLSSEYLQVRKQGVGFAFTTVPFHGIVDELVWGGDEEVIKRICCTRCARKDARIHFDSVIVENPVDWSFVFWVKIGTDWDFVFRDGPRFDDGVVCLKEF